ncbi:MAG: mannonate dehydratase [Paenibacillaceae bacterium]|nr:mannonate dehydratase [Paenibacillaceae bacterium]
MKRMRVAGGQLRDVDDESLRFLKQLGVDSVQLNTPYLPGEHRWEYEDLLRMRLQVESYGLELEAIENVPIQFYDKIMLGLPGRDEQIEHYQATIRHAGRAGIPILGHHFMPNFVWRTSLSTAGRGGALVTAFDNREAAKGINLIDYPANREGRIADEEIMWCNYSYFLEAVIPVAEEANVKLALHPDDPPVRELDGVTRLFHCVDSFKRAMALADSEAWGLNLCLGCCSEMVNGASDVTEMIDYFGPKGKILYVHFRDVQGSVPAFQECFIGEGNYDPAEVIVRLKRVGFNGFLLDDHVPRVVNDTDWGHRARGHAIGYMQGLLRMAAYADQER